MVLLWAGLEALFGPDSPGETVHRTSMNLSLFLAPSGEEARKLAKRVRDSYHLRSRIVHGRQSGLVSGSNPKDREKAAELIEETVAWLCDATRRIALDVRLCQVFQSGKERNACLESLPYRDKATSS